MPAYSHLADEERDQIAVMRAAGHSLGAIARAFDGANPQFRGSFDPTLCLAGAIRRFTPPEPINCAGGGKRS